MRLALPCLFTASLLMAQEAKPADAPKVTWSDKASLSLVAVGGNAQSQSFGVSNEYAYNWTEGTGLTFNLGAVRVSTVTTAYTATGTSTTDFAVTRTDTKQVTTDDYFANLRYSHTATERLFWFTGGGWERNVPSGINSRTMVNAGMGYWWAKNDATKFRTDLGLGYTREKPVLEMPGRQDSFATWSAVFNLEQKIGSTSQFASNLTFTDSLSQSQNYLGVWRNDLSTSLNKTLALKVGYAMTYANRPAYKAVDIIQTGSEPPVVLGQTSVPLKKLDTVFTASLVITF
jgi:hypothetical protein